MLLQGVMGSWLLTVSFVRKTLIIRTNHFSVLFAFKTVCCLIISVKIYTLENVSRNEKKTFENYLKMGYSECFSETIL